eukprot:s157_g25.t1
MSGDALQVAVPFCTETFKNYSSNPFNLSPKKSRHHEAFLPGYGPKHGGMPARNLAPGAPLPVQRKARVGPPTVKLRWSGQSFSVNLDDFASISELRAHIHRVTGVPAIRQTLILGGRRLPINEDTSPPVNEPTWQEIKDLVRPGQCLMMVGSVVPAQSSVPSPAPDTGDPVLAPRDNSLGRAEPAGNTSPTAAEASG